MTTIVLEQPQNTRGYFGGPFQVQPCPFAVHKCVISLFTPANGLDDSQHGDPMSQSNQAAERGVAEEWLGPGFFVPVKGGLVSVEGREEVPNPFPIVPQARAMRFRGLKSVAQMQMLADVSEGQSLKDRAGQAPFFSQLARAVQKEYALEGSALQSDPFVTSS